MPLDEPAEKYLRPATSGTKAITMPMTSTDIHTHYQQEWSAQSEAATDESGLGYSNPVEDAILYPAYERLIADLNIKVEGGRVLDVGSGSGRWIRFFLERYRPRALTGIDYSEASVKLLDTWHRESRAQFCVADITDPKLDLEGEFDLINVANVLFHIPEPDLFAAALRNLARLVASTGFIVTTEYLPRCTMRTEWMMVRSRYEFEAAVRAAGLHIGTIRAFSFFSNDPMGLDGPDSASRHHFHKVRAGVKAMLSSNADEQTKQFFIDFLTEVEQAALSFARERIAQIDLPSQKLVVLKRVISDQ